MHAFIIARENLDKAHPAVMSVQSYIVILSFPTVFVNTNQRFNRYHSLFEVICVTFQKYSKKGGLLSPIIVNYSCFF